MVSHHRFKITQYWTDLWQYTILLLQSALPFGKAERIHRIAPSWSHKWELYWIEIVKFTAKTWHHQTTNSLQFNSFDLLHFSGVGLSNL